MALHTDRILLRASPNTKKGEARRKLLEEIRVLALQEKKEFNLMSSRLVWWGLAMAASGHSILHKQKQEVNKITTTLEGEY